MPFAAELRDLLREREKQVPAELATGATLRQILTGHLRAVEAMADGELLTSVLLLDAESGRVWHGAAPSLPPEYCESIDGSEIGPNAGSCGTAAYFGKPVYVSDIAQDALWRDYAHLALPHGLRSCWSTPIRDTEGKVIGTFAIYRRAVGNPSTDEIDAIDLITGHVADAIMRARSHRLSGPATVRASAPNLRLVESCEVEDELTPDAMARLLTSVARLEQQAAELERRADAAEAADRDAMRSTAIDCRRLVSVIRARIPTTEPAPG